MQYEKQKVAKPPVYLPSVPVMMGNPMWNPHHEHYQWMYSPSPYDYMSDCQMNGHSSEECRMVEMYNKPRPMVNRPKPMMMPTSHPIRNEHYYTDPRAIHHPRHYPQTFHHSYPPDLYYQHRIFSHPM